MKVGARASAFLVLLVALPVPRRADAVQLEALDPTREWRVAALSFHGNTAVGASVLRAAMVTKARRWYEVWKFWQPPPAFEPATFEADLERLSQLYRNHGYYHVLITHDLELPPQGDEVRVGIWVEEGPPVYVESVAVETGDEPKDPADRRLLLDHIPIARDQVFAQDRYERAYAYLRSWYREHGFARVKVIRSAEVDVRRDAASVRYRIDSGPACIFGTVQVTGTTSLDPAIIRREIAFESGDPFKQSKVEQTRANIVGLRLFSSVRVDEDDSRDPRVDLHVRVVEGPTHEVRVGVGYDTEEQIRALASWRDYNFLGGARQLGFTARISLLRRTIAADFLQPHFPGPHDRVRLLASEEQELEETYDNDRSRLSPRIEWQALPTLTPYAFYRIEYDSLSSLNDTIKADPRFRQRHGFLSGFGFGVDYNGTDDPLDPTRGWAALATIEPVGGLLGGDFSFVRGVIEGRRFQPLPELFGLAMRARLGTAEPFGGTRDIPLFERFYAGGINSVRGYERRHVGPFEGGDPIGGRSLVEGSVELRRPITEKFGWAVFLDAGQVSAKTLDFPLGDLRYGAGFGVRYKSPIGPLRVDLGFPTNPPDGDPFWQVHVSIGQAF